MDEYAKRGELLDLLRANPHGITAKQAAEKLKQPFGTTGSHLSKLALYGLIHRSQCPDHRHGCKYLYRFTPQVAVPRIKEFA